jgi:formyltetrahydrofolate-dependent phosphoribosylglycinamide formyltransferase
MPIQPLKLAVLISGGGTTLQNLIDHISQGKLTAEICVVISSQAGAYGLIRAQKHDIPHHIVPRKHFSDLARFNHALNQTLRPYHPDLIVLAGFLSLFHPEASYQGKVMNIHPALIPAFCGQGYYGNRVHQAVLDYGVKISGCTVHFIDDTYDTGPIILQSAVPVDTDDTVETLAARVFAEECKLYPRAIQLYAEGRLRIEGRRVRIIDKEKT